MSPLNHASLWTFEQILLMEVRSRQIRFYSSTLKRVFFFFSFMVLVLVHKSLQTVHNKLRLY